MDIIPQSCLREWPEFPVAVHSFEEELTRDVMEIMTVFCAQLYGRRSHKSKKMAEQIENIVSEEKPQLELSFGSPPNTTDRTQSE